MIDVILLEGDMSGLGALIALIFAIGFGPPILLGIIGIIQWNKTRKKTAKVLFILATIYLLISLGICGSLMA